MPSDAYELKPVVSPVDWQAYHRLRRAILFEARGRFGVYREDHPDETAPGNQSFLLTINGAPVGTLRLDRLTGQRIALRLVAIDGAQQGRGHGSNLLYLAEDHAAGLGARELVVNAAPEAVGFYSRAGFETAAWPDPARVSGKSVQMIKSLLPEKSGP